MDEYVHRARYEPPWSDVSIIGIAGSSGSGKTSLSLAILSQLNLPWVVLVSSDSFYKPLTPEQSAAAFRNEYDFDSPDAIDFDLLVEKLQDLKAGKKAELPVYSFSKHAREDWTTTIYSPHVLLVEGIYALRDERILDLLDLKLFTEADPDVCLSRRLLRDVRERGRDIEGCIKQWSKFVKPAYGRYVVPQRDFAVQLNIIEEKHLPSFTSSDQHPYPDIPSNSVATLKLMEYADIIVPRGAENKVAISMVCDRIHSILAAKSKRHQLELRRLGVVADNAPLSANVTVLSPTNQVRGINTILMDTEVERESFIHYFDRLAVMLIEKATELGLCYKPCVVETPVKGRTYQGLHLDGEVSAVVILRGGSILETGLKRVIPDARIGRMLIQTDYRTGEPALHFLKLARDISGHKRILLLDPQLSSGGAALMAVRILLDHGVAEQSIVFVVYCAGSNGIKRLMSVFPGIRVVVCRIVDDLEARWVEERYFGA